MKLTLFGCPKPLDGGHIETIQRNAVTSWTLLPGRPEVILFGGESTRRLAADLGVRYADQVSCTETGAPLLDELFGTMERLAAADLLAYVNADIVLLPEFTSAIARVSARCSRFLLIGQRIDLDLRKPLDFVSGWDSRLRDRAERDGTLHGPTGIDYFVFRRGLWGQLPPFALGRTVWDNWLLHRARELGAVLVDATPVVMAVHQNHDYGHVQGGVDEIYEGHEARRNYDLAGGWTNMRFVDDATHVLTRRFLAPALAPRHLARRWHWFLALTRSGRVLRHVAASAQWRLRRLPSKVA